MVAWPYQPLIPAAAQQEAGAASYTLTADAGSFALSGQAAGLLAARRLAGDVGSVALSGQDAGLLAACRIDAGQGDIDVTGQAAGLLAARLLAGAHGVHALSGQDAGLSVGGAGYALTAEAGSFALAGQAGGLGKTGVPVTVSQAVQLGIYGRLRDQVPALPLYDHVPYAQIMPYAVLLDQVIDDDDTLAQLGYRHRLTLQIWSAYRGQKEVLELLDACWTALHACRLTIQVGRRVVLRCHSQQTVRDGDGLSRRGDLEIFVRTALD